MFCLTQVLRLQLLLRRRSYREELDRICRLYRQEEQLQRRNRERQNGFPDFDLELDWLYNPYFGMAASYTGIGGGGALLPGKLPWAQNERLLMLSDANWYNVKTLYDAILEMKGMALHTVSGKRNALAVLDNAARRLGDVPVDVNARFPDGLFSELICEELGAWRGEFVQLRIALSGDRMAELGAANGANAIAVRGHMDATVALPRLLSEMMRQLLAKRSAYNRAKFENEFRLSWA